MLQVQTIGHCVEDWKTIAFFLKLVDKQGKKHRVLAFSLDSVTAYTKKFGISYVTYMLPSVDKSDLERREDELDLLLGSNNAELHPRSGYGENDVGKL